jgi:DNA repair exonuclease SbcCD ATPase subunit
VIRLLDSLHDQRPDHGLTLQRVIAAIQDAARSSNPVSASSIARAASVDRSFLDRHPDLLAQVHAAQAAPAAGTPGTAAVSHAALQADLANALDRSRRLAARVRQLEARLSQLLGEQAWHASGLGAPADIDELQRKLTRLEQAQADLTARFEERTEELRAARDANRELTRALNQRHLHVP